MARVLDIGDQLDQWNLPASAPDQEDADALRRDWEAVGQDLIDAATKQ